MMTLIKKTQGRVSECFNSFMPLCSLLTIPSNFFSTARSVSLTAVLLFNFNAIAGDGDMPTGGIIVGGDGTIIQAGTITTINQNTGLLAIDWDTFNLGINGQVNFIQPGINSIALNRILDVNPSEIHGQINSNGNVFLLNPYGVIFGETASVNVGGLVASTLSLSTEGFLNGDYSFSDIDGVDGSVINYGLINASTGGSITLLGQQVANHGLISANLGAVNLAAGREAILTFDSAGLLGVRITQAVLQDELGLDPAVLNAGEITAAGGQILMTASVSEDVFSQAVNIGDYGDDYDVEFHEDGSFSLGSRSRTINRERINPNNANGQVTTSNIGTGADVVNTGTLDVSTSSGDAGEILIIGENITNSGDILANAENGNGGEIKIHSNDTTLIIDDSLISARSENNGEGGSVHVLGEKVGLLNETVIDVSGANGGGEALIGGDYRGENVDIRNASGTYIGQDTQIIADALQDGNGGRIISWGNDSLRAYGNIYARGGVNGGNGGFVETSAHVVDLNIGVDVSASNGSSGTWLIDPYNITISNNIGGIVDTDPSATGGLFTNNGSDSNLYIPTLLSTLTNGANVIIETSSTGPAESAINGNITLANVLDLTGTPDNDGASTLTLRAHHDINIDANIEDSNGNDDRINLFLYADSNNDGSGDVNINAAIDTEGGNITASGQNIFSTFAGDIITQGGNVLFTAVDTINLLGDINTTGVTNSVGVDIAGGNIDLVSTTGSITAANLISSGGVSSTNSIGQVAGNITLNAETAVSITGSITATGGAGVDSGGNGGGNGGRSGGVGGAVNITTNTGVINIQGTVNSSGGDGDGDDGNDPASGGDAGSVTLTGDTVIVNAITANGGASIGNDSDGNRGANGGAITLNGDITLNGNLSTIGRTNVDDDGDGGTVILNGSVVLAADNISIDASGGNRGNICFTDNCDTPTTTSIINGDGVNAANLTLTGNNVLLTGDIGSVTAIGDLTIDATGSVDAVGIDNITHRSITANSLSVNQSTSFTSGNINTGNVTDGGIITINSSDIIVGAINTSGTNSGGNVTLTATDNTNGGTPTITLNGNVNATDTTDGTTNGTVSMSLNGGDSPLGSFIINATTDFASAITLTGSSGIDMLLGANRANTWTNTTLNTNLTFSAFENLIGNLGVDTFNLTSLFSGLIDGAGGILDELTITNNANQSVVLGVNGNVNNIESITVVGIGNNTITGANVENNWLINNPNEGIINSSISFFNFANLIGGTDVDNFVIGATGSVSDINGGGGLGLNTLTGRDTDNEWDISGSNSGVLYIDNTAAGFGTSYVDGFSNIQNITGGVGADSFVIGAAGAITAINGAGGVNTLTGRDTDNEWDISGSNSGVLYIDNTAAGFGTSYVDGFSNIQNIIGGAGADSFVMGTAGVMTSINGAGGINTLTGRNTDNDWSITNSNAGVLSNAGGVAYINSFTGIGNLIGGAGVDNFAIGMTGSIASINGAGGINTLTGRDTDNDWSITNTNAGVLSNAGGVAYVNSFTGIENLVGGAGVDNFVMGAAGNIVSINGVGESNSLTARQNVDNIWSFTSASSGSLSLLDPLTVYVNSFSNIQAFVGGGFGNEWADFSGIAGALALNAANFFGFNGIIGNGALSTLTGQDGVTNTWTVGSVNAPSGVTDGNNDGTFSNINGNLIFVDFANLVGGNFVDLFTIGAVGSIASIDGAAGTNTLTGRNTDNDWLINNSNAGVLSNAGGVAYVNSFTGIENLVGGAGVDNFVIGVTGNITSINGSGGTNTLTGRDTDNDWLINNSNSGVLSNAGGVAYVSSFTGIENLIGGAGVDDFVIGATGSIASLNGAGGTNTLTGRDTDNDWLINNSNAGVLSNAGGAAYVNSFTGIGNLVGGAGTDNFVLGLTGSIASINGAGGTNTLTGRNTDNDWLISNSNAGVLSNAGGAAYVNSFTGIGNLVGGAGTDNFVMGASGSLASINGAGGTNTLTGRDTNNDWSITNSNTGVLSNAGGAAYVNSFTGIGNLVGGAGTDNFVMGATGSLTSINGAGGTNTLTGRDTDNGWLINNTNAGVLSNASGAAYVNSFTGIENLIGGAGIDNFIMGATGSLTSINGAGGTNTLTGRDTNNDWSITNTNEGVLSVAGAVAYVNSFTSINNLVGGAGIDNFVLAANGSVTGFISGGAGTGINTLTSNNAATNNWLLTSLYSGTLNGGLFSNIQNLIGNSAVSDTLTAIDQNNDWLISSLNTGTVGATGSINLQSFSGMENLNGGSGDDRFTFNGGSVSGVIDAGAHINGDIVDYSLQATVNVTLANALNGVLNAEIVEGNNINSTLTGDNIASNWLINGENDGTIGGLQFINFNNLIGGAANDVFNITESGSITGNINGGGGSNTLMRSNTTGANSWLLTSANTGVLSYDYLGSTANVNFQNIGQLTGSDNVNVTDSLTAIDQANNWLINGVGAGILAQDVVSPTDTISFSGMENLNGGSGDDRFRFDGGSVTGLIDAGAHINGDLIDYSNLAVVNLTLANALNGVANVEIIRGNNTNSTLIGNNIVNNWLITGQNDGTLGGITFIDFNNLTGGTNIDNFVVQANGSITGVINGGVGAGIIDTLNLTALNNDISVSLESTISADFNIAEIEQVQANIDSNLNNTIIASNTNNIWNIDGSNSGLLNTSALSLNFSGFANLTGGSLNDTFNLNSADDISGLIDGAGGNDELNMLSLGRDITVRLGPIAGIAANDTIYANNIETIRANSSRTNTIVGNNVASNWVIDSINSSSIENVATAETVVFSGFNILTGGTNDDAFEIINASLLNQINGGDGAGNDTIDYSNTTADINITIGNPVTPSGVNINGIEGLIGNNGGNGSFNSTISVVDGNNTWTISDFDGNGIADGINDGQFQDANGNVISFINFNILQGGDGIDIFNIQNGASITGYIHGGAGDDELRLSINSAGQTRFVGGLGNDSVLLNGGGSNYNASYTSNVGGDDLLVYTNNNGNAYSFSYAEVETVQDNIVATNFTINGSSGIDLINLATGYVSVNNATALQYTNRTNLILAAEAGDTFDLVGDLNLGNGSLTVNDSFLTNSSGSLITASRLNINSVSGVGTNAAAVNINVNGLVVNNGLGDIYLNESNNIEIQGFNTSGNFNLAAGGNVTQATNVILNSNNNFTVDAIGNINLTNQNLLSGPINLASDGDINLTNALDTNLAGINAQNLNLNINGNLTDSGPIIVSGVMALSANNNDITFDNVTNNFNIVNITNANNVTLVDTVNLDLNNIDISGLLRVNAENVNTTANINAAAISLNATASMTIGGNLQTLTGDISLAANQIVQNADLISGANISVNSLQNIRMAAGTSSRAANGNINYTAVTDIAISLLSTPDGTVVINTSNGQIIDNNGNAAADNIVANRAELTARNGIGVNNALETQLVSLFAENAVGQININNRGSITLERLATSGDITFNNTNFNGSDINFMPGSVDAGYEVGTLIMTTEGGSFLGVGPIPDFTNADIVARNATFIDSSFTGTFGSIGRPLVLRVRDSAVISVRTSFSPLFATPLPDIDDSNSLNRFSSFDTISAITGGQLVEVESLVDVDPAIFTDLRNYNNDEVAVRLPNDQLFDYDEDEDEDEDEILNEEVAVGF